MHYCNMIRKQLNNNLAIVAKENTGKASINSNTKLQREIKTNNVNETRSLPSYNKSPNNRNITG